MKEKHKKLQRRSLAQLGVLLGQMTHAQPIIYDNARRYAVDERVFKDWTKWVHDIINNEV